MSRSTAARLAGVAVLAVTGGTAAGYHEWISETPVIDVVRTVIGVASVLVGCSEIFGGTPKDRPQPDETEP